MNISIKGDTYKFLKSLKGRNESFSDVILRFKEKKTTNGKCLLN
jgi:predicted CopG family antitoxin